MITLPSSGCPNIFLFLYRQYLSLPPSKVHVPARTVSSYTVPRIFVLCLKWWAFGLVEFKSLPETSAQKSCRKSQLPLRTGCRVYGVTSLTFSTEFVNVWMQWFGTQWYYLRNHLEADYTFDWQKSSLTAFRTRYRHTRHPFDSFTFYFRLLWW